MDKNLIYNFAWYPIGPGDSEVWIETEQEREERIEQEKKTENPEEYEEERIAHDIENETHKENK